uniref:Diphthamide biosynthesis protein 3 n=1 Tax=Amblyomma aureolatum TaxID=187763 RepID=A0A1E1X0X3_9ACAR
MDSRTQTQTTPEVTNSLVVAREGNVAGFRDELIYETITLDDCHYDESLRVFYYMCPCGDLFEITLTQLQQGNLVSECPSCSLRVRVNLEDGELDRYSTNS